VQLNKLICQHPIHKPVIAPAGYVYGFALTPLERKPALFKHALRADIVLKRRSGDALKPQVAKTVAQYCYRRIGSVAFVAVLNFRKAIPKRASAVLPVYVQQRDVAYQRRAVFAWKKYTKPYLRFALFALDIAVQLVGFLNRRADNKVIWRVFKVKLGLLPNLPAIIAFKSR